MLRHVLKLYEKMITKESGCNSIPINIFSSYLGQWLDILCPHFYLFLKEAYNGSSNNSLRVYGSDVISKLIVGLHQFSVATLVAYSQRFFCSALLSRVRVIELKVVQSQEWF